MVQMHLDKFIANAAPIARRKASALIKEGVVFVNNLKETDPAIMVDSVKDIIKLDRKVLKFNPVKIYYALYKPRAVVATTSDPEKRVTVLDFIKKKKMKIFPVGRLDYMTSGLILLTNDGDFANKITHPSFKISKEYNIKVSGHLNKRSIAGLKKGIVIDGKPVSPFIIKSITHLKRNTTLKVVIFEGRNRILRRVFEKIYHPVMTLTRTRIGPVTLRGLKSGKYRELNNKEIEVLKQRKK
ncbi:rRNA pseudouridine synthase [Candidatus Dependentiae bacterium]|nr:rRNA pseudouridine synthase [Candidatus Dependentiae bacterium]